MLDKRLKGIILFDLCRAPIGMLACVTLLTGCAQVRPQADFAHPDLDQAQRSSLEAHRGPTNTLLEARTACV